MLLNFKARVGGTAVDIDAMSTVSLVGNIEIGFMESHGKYFIALKEWDYLPVAVESNGEFQVTTCLTNIPYEVIRELLLASHSISGVYEGYLFKTTLEVTVPTMHLFYSQEQDIVLHELGWKPIYYVQDVTGNTVRVTEACKTPKFSSNFNDAIYLGTGKFAGNGETK